ncbi:MAG: NAD(P)-binding domain-containing protein [Candidatus Limnocylindrales bacterium]
MHIAIIGAGNVGGNLGMAASAVGHHIVFGVRDPASAKARAAVEGVPGATATDSQSAMDAADLVVIALQWDVLPDILSALHVRDGLIVVDATNRLITPRVGSAPSGGEEVARLLPGARVVKAFNTIGAENLPSLRQRPSPAAGFLCGDDGEAKTLVGGLVKAIGFEPFDVGPLAMSGILEGMTRMWVGLSRTHGRSIAYSITHAGSEPRADLPEVREGGAKERRA